MARARNTNLIDVVLDERSFNRALKTIEKYEGRDWRGRVIAAFLAGAKLLVAPMRRVVYTGGVERNRGGIAGSIQAKLAKKSPGVVVKVNVKPRNRKGAHGHLISQGHEVWSHGSPTGRYYEGNNFVGKVIDAHEGRVVRFIEEQPLDIDGASVSGFLSGLRPF